MGHKEKFQQADPITWLQIHNLLPIILIIISALTGWYFYQNKVDRLEQGLLYQQAAISQQAAKIDALQSNREDQALKIKELEVKLLPTVKGVSTFRSVITPKVATPSGVIKE